MSKEHFEKTLKFVLQREGGYVNDPNDLGGETNKGITYRTYNAYRKSKGLPPKSVKDISDEEVKDIYYNNYYKASGADKISDPKLSAYVFDTAVNMGVSRAKTFLSQSNGSADKFEQLRRAKYDEFVAAKPSQKRYLQGWNNRVTELKNFSDKTFSSTSMNSDSQEAGSSRLFKLGIEKNVYNIDTRTPSQKLDDEIREKYKHMKNQRLQRVFSKSESNRASSSGSGKWVTINGNHVYID